MMELVDTCLASLEVGVKQLVRQRGRLSSARDLHEFELELHAKVRCFADSVTERVLRSNVEDDSFQQETSSAAHRVGRFRSGGQKTVGVRLFGGTKVFVKTRYLKPDRRGLPGRPRGVGRRGKGGTGLYPALAVLGVCFGLTPATASEICRQVTDSDSVRSGREALGRRGLDLGHKQILRVIGHMGTRAVNQRDDWLSSAAQAPPGRGPLAGKRVVITTDGGRLRERVAKTGRPLDNGHRRYDAPWREPKLIAIYTVDDQGSLDPSFPFIYDGTLRDCDATFNMLTSYLLVLGARDAQDLVVVGDGAKWIWNRVDALVQRVGIARANVTQVIDWYHACETLHEIASIPASWPSTKRMLWAKKAKRHLYAGRVGNVLTMIDELAVGRRSKNVLAHRDYFARNTDRMRYAEVRKNGLPIGSGSIESAVRRVINMRMKGNGTFWLQDKAEGMLLLRSYLKAGRFDDLMLWSFAAATAWWPPNAPDAKSPIRELQRQRASS